MKDDTEKPPRKPRTRARKEGVKDEPEKPPRKPRTRARKEGGEPAPATRTPRRRRAAAVPLVDAASAAVTGVTGEVSSADAPIVPLHPEEIEGDVAAELASAAGDADATVPEPRRCGRRCAR